MFAESNSAWPTHHSCCFMLYTVTPEPDVGLCSRGLIYFSWRNCNIRPLPLKCENREGAVGFQPTKTVTVIHLDIFNNSSTASVDSFSLSFCHGQKDPYDFTGHPNPELLILKKGMHLSLAKQFIVLTFASHLWNVSKISRCTQLFATR